ncbi:hypothetical protein B566_EDAN014356 [Ephemera danica]|nr:hypothetical protein B566_EDAN014356 [Ephemera danica]
MFKLWKGSVYKLVWRELFAYLTLYFALNLVYRVVLDDQQKRVVLDDQQKRTFEKVRNTFAEQTESIPMSFVLGFYEERGRLMRRNIVRYAMLSYVITLQHVSLRVKRRFPTWQHMVDAV